MCLIYASTIRQISAPIIWDICLKMGRHAFPFIPSKYNMGTLLLRSRCLLELATFNPMSNALQMGIYQRRIPLNGFRNTLD